MRFVDLTGRKFGRLTVIQRAENRITKGGQSITMWRCRCDCGNEVIVYSQNLKREHTQSCGCIQKEKPAHYKHGYSHTRLGKIYDNMKDRCYNPNNENYRIYGGENKTICDEWLRDRQSFFDWAMANGYADNLTIDRVDNSKGYSPDNCRWVDMKTQCNNRRSNCYIAYNGKTYTLKELSELYNIPYDKLKQRINKLHWNIEKAINTP